jgi:hypothetical protein
MTKRAPLFLLLLILAVEAFSQERPVAVKIADFDDRVESMSVFSEKVELLIKKLAKEPETTRAFIAVKGLSREASLGLNRAAKEIVSKSKTEKRTEITEPRCIYEVLPEKTELWLIPKGAETPYKHLSCGLISCPTLDLHGKAIVNRIDETLYFTANVTGGYFENGTTYLWSVKGGRIVDGQGQPYITVKAENARTTEVTATVKIGGMDPRGFCIDTQTYTTKIIPR